MLFPSDNQFAQIEAEDFYATGLACLAIAKKNQFKEKQLLDVAAQCLTQSLKADKEHVNSLMTLSYLLLLHQQPEQALKYLKQGLLKSPHHPLGLELMTILDTLPPPDFQAVAEQLNFEDLLKKKKT